VLRPKSDKPAHNGTFPLKAKKITTAPARTSKHAPAVQSSRHAVSRRRDVFELPVSLKSRDPRFDPTVTASSADRSALDKANKNYSFLSAYQASEILDLKAQIKKSKDPDVIATLKRQVMSLDSKMRAAEAQQRERDIVKRHTQKEKEAIKSGRKSKPYFLKRSDVKREALAEKLESMGKKARDKAMERKRKRVKSKESKGMPKVRRERLLGES
jgi:ribosomal RNA-processing protein 36